MATYVVKWTREKNRRKSEFRDKTRRSHDEFKLTLTKKDKESLLSTSDSKDKENFLKWEKRVAPAVAIGSSLNEIDLAVKKNIERLEQEVKCQSTLPKEVSEEANLPNLKTRSNDRNGLKLNQIQDKPLYSFLIDCKYGNEKRTNIEDLEVSRKKLAELKRQINFKEKKSVKKESDLEINDVRKRQMEEKIKNRRKESFEKLVFDSKMYEDCLKAQKEEKQRKKLLKEKQQNFMKALDDLCVQKNEKLRQEIQMKVKEKENYLRSNILYEKHTENQMKEDNQKRQELHQMAKNDIEARKTFEKNLLEVERREAERNYEYSIFKRAFGRKMRQQTRNKMMGK